MAIADYVNNSLLVVVDGDYENATTGHRLGWGKGFSFGEVGVNMNSWTVTTGATDVVGLSLIHI